MKSVSVARWLIVLLFLMLAVFVFNSVTLTPKTEKQSQLHSMYAEPFAVLKYFLEQEGTRVEIIEGYDPAKFDPAFFDGLSSDATVAFRLAEIPIEEALADSILDWVKRGGFLVISGLTYEDVYEIPANQLFEKLGIYYEQPEEPSFEETVFELDHYEIVLNLETEYHFSSTLIDEENDFWDGTSTGTTIVQKPISEGYVTIMTDIDIWTNEQIEEYDHIVFASFLFSGKDELYIFGTADKPHWIIGLTLISPGFVFFSTLLILLSLWFYGVRFGSMQKASSSNPSAFRLHLEASANYYWKTDKHQRLLTQVRVRLKQDITKAYSLRDVSRIDSVLPQLAEKTQLSPEVIKQSLEDWQPGSESDYIELVKRLQSIRNQL